MKKTDKLTIKEIVLMSLITIFSILVIMIVINFLIEVPRQLHELNEILRELKL